MLPNLLTFIRIIGSVYLLFLTPGKASFLAVYFLCGLSDMLDGFFARLLHAQSKTGAVLDGFADAIFIFICLAKLLPFYQFPVWVYLWCAVIACIKLSSLFSNYRIKHCVGFLSDYPNKIAGMLLFLTPAFCLLLGNLPAAFLAELVSTLAALHELSCILKPEGKPVETA